MKEYEELRDLARQIEEVARNHPAWSMAHEVIYCATGHLIAVARCMEQSTELLSEQERSRYILECLEKEKNKSFMQLIRQSLFFRDFIEEKNNG